jgi:hypothetical protein
LAIKAGAGEQPTPSAEVTALNPDFASPRHGSGPPWFQPLAGAIHYLGEQGLT